MTTPESALRISSNDGTPLAYVICATDPARTTFLTPPEANLQAGFVVYPAGGRIGRHYHEPVERLISNTCEVLILRRGRCEMDLYDDHQTYVTSVTLEAGNIVVLLSGGHGFRMIEDTVFIEVKQGPYLGPAEKKQF